MVSGDALVSIDFKLVPAQEARVSVFDRGFLYGDSVYEVVRTYHGRPLAMDRHFQRLQRSASSLGFALPFEGRELKAHFEDLIRRLGEDDCYVRVVVTRGACDIALAPPEEVTPCTVVIAGPLPPWPEDHYENGISLVTVGIRRNARGALNPMIKSGNYLNNVLAAMEARQAGAVDAIMLNADGFVTESTSANIFLVKGGGLVTPPVEAGILDGVSRHLVMELARENTIPCSETLFEPEALHLADECFITSTTREVMPVRSVDGHPIPAPGVLTCRLMALYKDLASRSV
ncbi:MAG: aminotransferase class IV [Planctomycetota bacterium]